MLKIQENELLSSFLARVYLVKNGSYTSRECAELLYRDDFEWRRFPIYHLSHKVREMFKQSNMSREQFLRHHTLLPLYRSTMPAEEYDSVLSSIFFENQRRCNLPYSYFGYGTKPYGTTNFCCFCLREQMREFGIIWFKVEWAFPGETFCVRHNVKLKSYRCNNCGSKYKNPQKMLFKLMNGKCAFCSNSMFDENAFADVNNKYWENVYPKMHDRLVGSRYYPNFSKELILNVMKYAGEVAKKRYSWKRSESYVNYVAHGSRDNFALRKYVKGECNHIYHKLFWTVVRDAFHDVNSFDEYLKKVSKVNVLKSSLSLLNGRSMFCFQQLDVK